MVDVRKPPRPTAPRPGAAVPVRPAPSTSISKPAVHRVGQPAPSVNRLGDPTPSDPFHSCMTCRRWSVCKDPKKSWNYCCSRWMEPAALDGAFQGTGTIEAVKNPAQFQELVRPTEIRDMSTVLDTLANRKAEVNLTKILDDALSSGFDIPPDLEVDDRDIPTPPNYFQWVRGKEYSGGGMDLFPMQHWVLLNMYGEYCPRCSDVTFIEAMHVNSDITEYESRTVFLEHGVCPQCRVGRAELVQNEELNEYYTMAGLAGQRSGKSMLTGFGESYSNARWIKLPNPQKIFGTMPNQLFVATYCSLTFGQVRQALWDPLIDLMTNSPWYRDYHTLLGYYGNKLGQELFHFKDIFVRYKHRNIMLVPSGPNKRTMRGATRLSGVIDEIGQMPFGKDNQNKTKMSAEEIHQSMENSLATLQAAHESLLQAGHNNLPRPMMICISSPLEVNDMIMDMNRKGQGSRITFTFKKATWDMNPKLPRNCNFISKKFHDNAQNAMRDFGCEPPMSSNPWISDIRNAVGIFTKKKNNITLEQYSIKSASGQLMVTGEVDFEVRSLGGRILALDAGYVNNHFAFSVIRLVDGLPVVEGLGELIPSYETPISYHSAYEEVLLPICRNCGVQFVVADRWNSIKILHDLEADAKVVPIDKYRVNYGDFQAFREAIYAQTIEVPRLEMDPKEILGPQENYPDSFRGKPMAHLLNQMFSVRDFPGKDVEKGNQRTDDLFRAVVLGLKAINDPEISAELNDDPGRRTQQVWGAVASRSSAGGAISTPIGAVGSKGKIGGGGAAAGSPSGGSKLGATTVRR